MFEGFSNVDALAPVPDPGKLAGGMWLIEESKFGNGKLLVNFSSFKFNPARGKLAWDPCTSPSGQKGSSPLPAGLVGVREVLERALAPRVERFLPSRTTQGKSEKN